MRRKEWAGERARRSATAPTGGAAGSSTRSTRARFQDSDGDGTGDLPGIIERLPYLGPDGLGVDAIWLSPIYPSPGRDIGYDVSDHTTIDPRFGTDADFDRLVGDGPRAWASGSSWTWS